MRNTMRTLMLALALSGLAAPALARPPHERGMPMMDPDHIDAVAAELKLDAATVQKLKDRLYAAKKEGSQLKADLENAKLEVRRLLDQDNPSKDAVLKQVEFAGQKEIALHKLRVGTMLDLRAMLTPEQRAKMRAMHQRDHDGDSDDDSERGHKRGKRGKHGDHDGPPPPPPRD